MSSKYTPTELARLGWYEQITWENLKPSDVTKPDRQGLTFLHHVARHGRWQNLPPNLKDKKYWKQSKEKETIYISAFKGTNINISWIPKEDLTETEIIKKTTKGESIISIAVNKGLLHVIPITAITEKVLTDPAPIAIESEIKEAQNKYHHDKIIHTIARKDQIKYLSKHLLNENVLSLQGFGGETIYHILAERSQLHLIPKECLTKKALTIKDKYGTNALVALAEYQPEIIPKELLTPELFYEGYQPENSYPQKWESPLQAWAAGRGWQKIPDHLLNKDSISLASPDSPLNYILKHYSEAIKSNTTQPNLKDPLVQKVRKLLILASKEELEKLKENFQVMEETTTHLYGKKLNASNLIKKEISKRTLLKELEKNKEEDKLFI